MIEQYVQFKRSTLYVVSTHLHGGVCPVFSGLCCASLVHAARTIHDTAVSSGRCTLAYDTVSHSVKTSPLALMTVCRIDNAMAHGNKTKRICMMTRKFRTKRLLCSIRLTKIPFNNGEPYVSLK